jgi:hypothetical protein
LQSLVVTLYNTEEGKIPGYLRAAGLPIKFDDQVPRQPPAVRAVAVPFRNPPGVGRGSGGGRGAPGRYRGPCWKCGVPGHNWAQCTQNWANPDHPIAVRERGQARDSTRTVLGKHVLL